MQPKLKFEVTSSLGRKVRVSSDYWRKIIRTKHPVMEGQEELVKQTLMNPDQVRTSRKDSSVYLYYRKRKAHYCCVVVRHLNGEGFIVTTYMTDRIKVGDPI